MGQGTSNYQLHYRTWHDDSDEHFALKAAEDRALISGLIRPPAGAALDVGCGMGFTIAALKTLGLDPVEGIDVDENQIESCRRRGLQAELVPDAAAYMLCRPERFMLVTMLDVLEHVPPQAQLAVLRAAHSSLRPNGILVIRVPNANSVIASRLRYLDFTHHSSFTELSLKFAIVAAGFANPRICEEPSVEQNGARGLKPFASQLRRRIVRWCWRQVLASELSGQTARNIPLSGNLVAVAQKE